MKHLSHIDPLAISLSDKGLGFDNNIATPSFQEKAYPEFKDFFESHNLDIDTVLYYIYRGISLRDDMALWKEAHLRYDITLIFAGTIGEEPIHTVGHFHIHDKAGYAYPEIYQVLSGNALFILQSENRSSFHVIEASSGKKVIIPPGFGHITLNPSISEPLIVANIFTDSANSDYSLFREHHGAFYHPHRNNGLIQFAPNPSYDTHPSLKYHKQLKPLPFGICQGSSLYQEATDKITSFEFLNAPERFLDNLSCDALFA